MTDDDRNGGLGEALGRVVYGDDWQDVHEQQRRTMRRAARRERIVSAVGAVLGFVFVGCVVALFVALVVLVWQAVL